MKKRPCKIGTVPSLVIVHPGHRVKIGAKIMVRDAQNGSKYFRVVVLAINDNGYFFADRM